MSNSSEYITCCAPSLASGIAAAGWQLARAGAAMTASDTRRTCVETLLLIPRTVDTLVPQQLLSGRIYAPPVVVVVVGLSSGGWAAARLRTNK